MRFIQWLPFFSGWRRELEPELERFHGGKGIRYMGVLSIEHQHPWIDIRFGILHLFPTERDAVDERSKLLRI